MAARQLLAEEFVGVPQRAAVTAEDRGIDATKDAIRRQQAMLRPKPNPVNADATTGMRRMPGQDRGVD